MLAAVEPLERNNPDGTTGERYGPFVGPVRNMMIHHTRLASDFAKLPNETLRDERLSIAARGHLAYLLCLPDGWNTTADAESRRARSLRGKRGEGRDAMRRIYAELKEHGYIHYVRTQDNGVFSTVIHVFDRPFTDVRLTDIPESRTSVPPAEMPECSDDWPDESSQVAPMYGSPGVGTPDVGTPVHRQAVQSYEDRTTEDVNDEGQRRVGDGVDDKEQPLDPGTRPQSSSVANSQNRRVHNGSNDNPLDATPSAAGTTAGRPQTAREDEPGGAAAPLSEPAQTAASDALRLGRWRSPQEIAAEQAAQSRARREAAERQAEAS